MKVKYDLHIHTALSPCALEEMTPNNIFNMSKLNDLQVIGVCDHNSCGNVKPLIALAQRDEMVVIPGIEVETREEIHVVCLFSDVLNVYKMQDYIYNKLPMLKNKPKILGDQILMDYNDNIIGEEERLLSFATDISYEEIINKAWQLGGITIPAHIDRPSYSVLSNLGLLPDNNKIGILEISQYADLKQYMKQYKKYTILQSSDSHELGFIGICNQWIDIPLKDGEILDSNKFIKYLRSKAPKSN